MTTLKEIVKVMEIITKAYADQVSKTDLHKLPIQNICEALRNSWTSSINDILDDNKKDPKSLVSTRTIGFTGFVSHIMFFMEEFTGAVVHAFEYDIKSNTINWCMSLIHKDDSKESITVVSDNWKDTVIAKEYAEIIEVGFGRELLKRKEKNHE